MSKALGILKERAREMNYPGNFREDVEAAFPQFEKFGEELKSAIHQKAWEDGHSAGYYDVVNQYYDLVAIAEIAVNQSSAFRRKGN